MSTPSLYDQYTNGRDLRTFSRTEAEALADFLMERDRATYTNPKALGHAQLSADISQLNRIAAPGVVVQGFVHK